MPTLSRILTEADFQRKPYGAALDLTAYIDLLESVSRDGGVGAVVTLSEGEEQRTEKRRLSVAAKRQGYQLKWRTAQPGTLRFVLAPEGQELAGSRKPRLAASQSKAVRRRAAQPASRAAGRGRTGR
jgi:hypothetical protein